MAPNLPLCPVLLKNTHVQNTKDHKSPVLHSMDLLIETCNVFLNCHSLASYYIINHTKSNVVQFSHGPRQGWQRGQKLHFPLKQC